jgi:hypothetical protein
MIAADDPKREEEPEDAEDFGFHYPLDYLTRVCWVLEASSFTYWPQGGGLDDQDSFLIADVMTWFKLMRRLRWEYAHKVWKSPEEMTARTGYNPLSEPH